MPSAQEDLGRMFSRYRPGWHGGVMGDALGIAVCLVLVYVIGVESTTNNRCLQTYNWTASVNGELVEFGYESLETDICSTTCNSPYPPPEEPSQRPPSVIKDSIVIDFYGAVATPDTNTTCLSVTYSHNRYGVDKIKGIQFILTGEGYNSHNTECCQIQNYTTPLIYQAVYDDQTGTMRQFHFDCFCDLFPSEIYKLTIRTLPVDENFYDDPKVEVDITVPDCTGRKWDQYCKLSKEEQWQPLSINATQVIPPYTAVKVTFDIAPSDYTFVSYYVTLTTNEYGSGKPVAYQTISLATANVFEVTLEGLRVNATSVMLYWEGNYAGQPLYPWVRADCQWVYPDCNTYGNGAEPVAIIGNPCDFEPCGELGSCRPDYQNYTCVCNDSAIYYKGTCIDNPCDPDPCSADKTCHIIGDSYRCECTDGITCIVDKCGTSTVPPSDCHTRATCVEESFDMDGMRKYFSCHCSHNQNYQYIDALDLCVDDTCGEGPCSRQGPCDEYLTENGVIYNCSCISGFEMDQYGMCQKNDNHLFIVIIAASILLGIVVVVAISFLLKKRSSLKKLFDGCPKIRDTQDSYENFTDGETGYEVVDYTPAAPVAGQVLIVCTEDKEEHMDVIHKFAAFLEQQAGIHPRLPSQNKKEIADIGLEAWLSRENECAQKVLWICSKGTLIRWRAKESGRAPVARENEFGDAFMKMLTITKQERETPGRYGKFLTGYFSDYSSREDVLNIFSEFPRYNLMDEVEKLCFNLLGEEQHTPKSRGHMHAVANYVMTPEGQAVQRAIDTMKNLVQRDPDWYEKEHSRVTHHSLSQDSGFQSQPGQSVTLEDISHSNMSQKMTGVLSLFEASSDTNSDLDCSVLSIDHCADVHHEFDGNVDQEPSDYDHGIMSLSSMDAPPIASPSAISMV